jgi:hypothetical protein
LDVTVSMITHHKGLGVAGILNLRFKFFRYIWTGQWVRTLNGSVVFYRFRLVVLAQTWSYPRFTYTKQYYMVFGPILYHESVQ